MKLCFDFQFFVPAKSVKNLLHINLYSKIMRKASKHPFGFFFGWFQFSQISIISYTKSENWVHVRLHPWKFHKKLYAAQSFQFVQEYKWPRSLRLTLVDITQKKLETNQCNGTRWDESVWMGDSFPCFISIFPSHTHADSFTEYTPVFHPFCHIIYGTLHFLLNFGIDKKTDMKGGKLWKECYPISSGYLWSELSTADRKSNASFGLIMQLCLELEKYRFELFCAKFIKNLSKKVVVTWGVLVVLLISILLALAMFMHAALYWKFTHQCGASVFSDAKEGSNAENEMNY